MVTLDDLVKLGDEAWSDAYDPLAYHLDEEDAKADKARIRAVVEALRDEIFSDANDILDLRNLFDKILADGK